MKRFTCLFALAFAPVAASACSGPSDDALMDSARAEFHQRYAAKDFRAIIENSFEAERRPYNAVSAAWWVRMSRDYGSFVKDTRDLGTYGDEGSSQMGTTVERWYNTDYSGTKMPIVEKFTWLIVDGTIRLRGFQVYPNAEVRCGWHLSPGGHFFMLRRCDQVQFGRAPATPPA